MQKRNLLSRLFVSFLILASSPSFAYQEYIPDDYSCYSTPEQLKITEGILDLRRCRAELLETKQLLETRVFAAERPWWQGPSFVIGGVIVSASVLGLLGVYVGRK
jgi:hypothetical protein